MAISQLLLAILPKIFFKMDNNALLNTLVTIITQNITKSNEIAEKYSAFGNVVTNEVQKKIIGLGYETDVQRVLNKSKLAGAENIREQILGAIANQLPINKQLKSVKFVKDLVEKTLFDDISKGFTESATVPADWKDPDNEEKQIPLSFLNRLESTFIGAGEDSVKDLLKSNGYDLKTRNAIIRQLRKKIDSSGIPSNFEALYKARQNYLKVAKKFRVHFG